MKTVTLDFETYKAEVKFQKGDRVRVLRWGYDVFGTVEDNSWYGILVNIDKVNVSYYFGAVELELVAASQTQTNSCPTCGSYPGTTHSSPTCSNEVVKDSLIYGNGYAHFDVEYPNIEPACLCQSPAAHENDCAWLAWKRSLG